MDVGHPHRVAEAFRVQAPARGEEEGQVVGLGDHWAGLDADLAAKPAVEVHISDVDRRGEAEPWRSISVFDGLVLTKISGKGVDGYREALEVLKGELGA